MSTEFANTNNRHGDTRGKIMFGNPDGTRYDKQEEFLESNGFNTPKDPELAAVQAEMEKASEQAARNLGVSALNLPPAEQLALEDRIARSKMTEDEVRDLVAAHLNK